MNDGGGTRKIKFVEEIYEDGVLSKGRKTEQLPKEPHFVKLYLKDLAHLRNLPAWVSGVLYELLKLMDYTNEIVLNSTIKNRIANKLELHPKTIDNALVKFTAKKILIRQGKGVFLGNPFIFGRGTWSDVEEIRLTVSYRANGDKDLQAEVLTPERLSQEAAMADERDMNASTYREESSKLEKEVIKHTRVKAPRNKKQKPESEDTQNPLDWGVDWGE